MEDIRYSRKAKTYRAYFLLGNGSLSIFSNITGIGSIFMAGLLLYFHASPSQIGLMAALPHLTIILQLFSKHIFRRTRSRKKTILFLKVAEYLFFYAIILAVRLGSGTYQIHLVLLCMLLGHAFRSLAGGEMMEWSNRFVPSEHRGRYYSNINLLANLSYILVALSVGSILDRFGWDIASYIAILLVSMVFSALEVFFYTRVKDAPDDHREEDSRKLRDMVRIPLRDSVYLRYIWFAALWNFARSLALPFYTYFSRAVLLFDFSFIALIGSIACILKMLTVSSWSRAGDRKGWRFLLLVSGHLFAATSFLWGFLSPFTTWLYLPVVILNGLFMIGINITVFNLNFAMSPDRDRLTYFGFSAAVIGIAAFLGPILGSFLITAVDASEFLSRFLNGYQAVFFLSGALQAVFIQSFASALKKNRLP